MATKTRKPTGKGNTKKTGGDQAVKKAIKESPQKIARTTGKRATAQRRKETFGMPEPSVVVYEIIQTDVFRETDEQADDRREEFGI
jgi:hypothetical protein